jgi:hypothetical protein
LNRFTPADFGFDYTPYHGVGVVVAVARRNVSCECSGGLEFSASYLHPTFMWHCFGNCTSEELIRKKYMGTAINNKFGKVYSSEYTVIRKMFFRPHRVGNCCSNVFQQRPLFFLLRTSNLQSCRLLTS